MIRSMTGFAAISREAGGWRAGVTIKAVNHRFLDLALKVPSALAAVESGIRARAQQRLVRGRVEIAVVCEPIGSDDRDVVLNEPLLIKLNAALASAEAAGLVAGKLSASDVMRVPQLLEIRPRGVEPPEPGAPHPALGIADETVDAALAALVEMRETEGRHLAADLAARVQSLAGMVAALESMARAGQASLETRLRDRLAALPIDLQPDPAALSQEVIRYVARSDVDEEIVRLRGHVDHWNALADAPEACGRKLDFLVQEMNREINTIGSKIEGPRVSEVVIAAKAELERIREQVQNVE